MIKTHFFSQALVAALAVSACANLASAENWPRFRGPNGAGMAEGGFTAAVTQEDIAWKIDLPGIGHSSPIVWDDHVYVTSADENAGVRFVFCLSPADGKVIWKDEYKFASYHKHNFNSFASATPAADELGVYVAWSTPQEYTLLAFDHAGKERWHAGLGTYKSAHGSGASPIVVGDLVVINDDQEQPGSALYAVDRKTGKLKWKLERNSSKKAAMSTPSVWKPKDGPEQLVISSWGGGIEGVDIKTGKRLWQAADVFFSRSIGSPMTTDELVIGVCGEPKQHGLVAIKPYSEGSKVAKPKTVYSIKDIGPHCPTPLIKGDKLLMWNDFGQVTCADLQTGKTIWTEKIGGSYFGSPVLVGDVMWAISKEGELVGINVADGFKKVCTLKLGEGSEATPAVAGGRMFLRTMSHMICLKQKAVARAD